MDYSTYHFCQLCICMHITLYVCGVESSNLCTYETSNSVEISCDMHLSFRPYLCRVSAYVVFKIIYLSIIFHSVLISIDLKIVQCNEKMDYSTQYFCELPICVYLHQHSNMLSSQSSEIHCEVMQSTLCVAHRVVAYVECSKSNTYNVLWLEFVVCRWLESSCPMWAV